ncbi:hypothetical protein BC629DRAFT_1177548 [Irpex lacteus]|nr:hypothetical protein BC629DRAFT_1177548 [Irpex lacteus]
MYTAAAALDAYQYALTICANRIKRCFVPTTYIHPTVSSAYTSTAYNTDPIQLEIPPVAANLTCQPPVKRMTRETNCSTTTTSLCTTSSPRLDRSTPMCLRMRNSCPSHLPFRTSYIPYTVSGSHATPMTRCLSPTSVTIEPTTTKRGNTFFQLTSTLQKQWQSCEAIILELQRQLTRRAGLLYLETSVPPPPTAFGYVDSYHSRSEALLHLKKALSAFTARLAFLSYLVLRDEMKGLDTWTELALQRDPLPLAICNAFRLSWISDWTVPRVGAFVDIGRHILPTGGSHWHEDCR